MCRSLGSQPLQQRSQAVRGIDSQAGSRNNLWETNGTQRKELTETRKGCQAEIEANSGQRESGTLRTVTPSTTTSTANQAPIEKFHDVTPNHDTK